VGKFCPPGSGSGYGSRDPIESGSTLLVKIPLPVYDWKLGESLQGLLGPGAPERPVPVPVPGYDPGDPIGSGSGPTTLVKIPLPVDDGKLGEALQGLLGPGAPERPVPVPVPGYDPGGRVAHLVDQGVPQSIPAVYHLAKAH
jgi:hypothetical protein